MIHPIRSAPALVLTAVVGMSALPGSAPIRFTAPVSVQGRDLAVAAGSAGLPRASRPDAVPAAAATHVASDDAGHRYLVETLGNQSTLTAWSVKKGAVPVLEFAGGSLPAAESGEPRPALAAHGNGHLFFVSHQPSTMTHPLGLGSGSGFGAGRSVLFASYDGGRTFDKFGYTLKGSDRCGVAADRAPASRRVYVVCSSSDSAAMLRAYTSADDGHTFERYPIAQYNLRDTVASWPTVAVAPDGTVWALYVDAAEASRNVLRLFRSRDRGRTWTAEDVTPAPGRYESAVLSLSRDGSRFGIGVFYQPVGGSWRVYGAVWSPGTLPRLVSLDDRHPAEPSTTPRNVMGSYFGSDGRLSVAWTHPTSDAGELLVSRSN